MRGLMALVSASAPMSSLWLHAPWRLPVQLRCYCLPPTSTVNRPGDAYRDSHLQAPMKTADHGNGNQID